MKYEYTHNRFIMCINRFTLCSLLYGRSRPENLFGRRRNAVKLKTIGAGMFMKVVSLSVILMSMTLTGRSQDPEFSQFYANPLYLNPAFAGAENFNRAILNYRNQWPSIDNGFITYNASYDQFIGKLHGGVGVLFNVDDAGDGLLTTTQASLMYAYTLQVSYKLFFNFALQGSYFQRSLNWDMLRFGDQIDLLNNLTLPSGEKPPESTTVRAPDFAVGAIFGYKSALHGGIAVHHLTEPNTAFYHSKEDNLPMKITAHLGGNINLEGGSMNFDPKFFISPNILYQQQGMFHQVNAGVYVTWLPVVLGAWYRHNLENPDAFILLAGIDYRNLKVGYSYDITVSGINTGGAHELSITWQFNEKDKLRTIYPLRAPGF